MAESVLVRCPICHREHTYTAPVYPCPCTAPVVLPLLRSAPPVPRNHRTWEGTWVSVRCRACGQLEEWPQPELACDCGTLLCLPVAHTPSAPPHTEPHPTPAPRPSTVRSAPPVRRPAFHPVTIRTAQDARTAAAQYLRWLGFTDVRVPERRPSSGVDLRGPEVVAHVDPSTSPTPLRDIETLWLNGLNESAAAVCFSHAGYARDARTRADDLGVPLFVLDLTGTPQPVNDPADDLIRTTPGG